MKPVACVFYDAFDGSYDAEEIPKCNHWFGHGYFARIFGFCAEYETIYTELGDGFHKVLACDGKEYLMSDGFHKVLACDGKEYLMSDHNTGDWPVGTLLPFDEEVDRLFERKKELENIDLFEQ